MVNMNNLEGNFYAGLQKTRNDPNDYSKRHWAARVIQSRWRAHRLRRDYLRTQDAIRLIQAHIRGWYTRRQVAKERHRRAMDVRYQEVMHKYYERIKVLEKEKRLIEACPVTELDEWDAKRNTAASKIQAHWRGILERRRWLQRSPERQQRDQASRRIQEAFRSLVSARRTRHDAEEEGKGQDPALTRLPTIFTGEADGNAALEAVGRNSPDKVRRSVATRLSRARETTISLDRRRQLEKQINERVETFRGLTKQQLRLRPDPEDLDCKLNKLRDQRMQREDTELAVLRQRQRTLVMAENLFVQLQQLPKLSDIPADSQPHHFPRPPRGSEREAVARQAHALALAAERCGRRWWRHLKIINKEDITRALLDTENETWDTQREAVLREWDKIMEEEEQRDQKC